MKKKMACKDVYPHIVDEVFEFEKYKKNDREAVNNAIRNIRKKTNNRMAESTCRSMFYAAKRMLRGESVDYISYNAKDNMGKRIEEILRNGKL